MSTITDTLSLRALDARAQEHVTHARHCHKAPTACPSCQQAIAFYGSLPLPVLSRILGEGRRPLADRVVTP